MDAIAADGGRTERTWGRAGGARAASARALPAWLEGPSSMLCWDLAAEMVDDPTRSHAAASRFVADQLLGMPAHVRWPVLLAIGTFGWARLVTGGRPYHRLAPARRRLHRERWRAARLGACRDLLRLYASLVALVVHAPRGTAVAAGPR